MTEDVILWLKKYVASDTAVSGVFVFGSILNHGSNCNDIDVAIIFENWENRDRLLTIERNFSREFSIPLHIQGFHVSQSAEVADFKKFSIGNSGFLNV